MKTVRLPKGLICSCFVLLCFCAKAQNYQISFSADGDANYVETVVAENLTQNLSISLNGSDILFLNETGTIGIQEVNTLEKRSPLSIYPNPSQSKSSLEFYLPEQGQTKITIYDLLGKMITQHSEYLYKGNHKFSLPSLNRGVYAVVVSGNSIRSGSKLISNSAGKYTGEKIQYVNFSDCNASLTKKAAKKASENKALKYNEGDLIRLTGKSTIYTTIEMLPKPKTQTLNFHFIKCTDGDGNHYPIVRIGNSYWMAENLRTTKSNAGTDIAKKSSALDWKNAGTGSICMAHYNFDAANALKYGAYYSYAAAQIVVPTGWRLPQKSDYNQLLKILQKQEEVADQSVINQLRSTTGWNVAGNNKTGFNAMATGILSNEGAFSDIESVTSFWTGDKKNGNGGVSQLSNAKIDLSNYYSGNYGCVIRCMVDKEDSRTQMLTSIFGQDAFTTDTSKKGTPLGDNYIVVDNSKKLFFAANKTKANKIPQVGMITPGATNTFTRFSNQETDRTWFYERLKKSVAQKNGKGRENLVYAVYHDGAYENPYNLPEAISATQGKVTLHIFGDSTENYTERVIELPIGFLIPKTFPAVDSGYLYNMSTGLGTTSGKQILAAKISILDKTYNISSGYTPTEYSGDWEFLSRNDQLIGTEMVFSIKAGDVNNDGVDDILLCVYDKLAIFDGRSYQLIAEKSFGEDHSSVVSNQKVFLLRAEVADIDNNGKNDLVVISSAPESNSLPVLHIYYDGDLNGTHSQQNIDIPNIVTRVANIAIGDIDGDNRNELVVTAKSAKSVTPSINSTAYVAYYTYNSTNKNFQQQSTAILYYANGSATSIMDPIALARFRGATFPYDIIIKNEVLRLENGTLMHPYGASALGTNINLKVDQIAVGNFDGNEAGKDQVYFLDIGWHRAYKFYYQIGGMGPILMSEPTTPYFRQSADLYRFYINESGSKVTELVSTAGEETKEIPFESFPTICAVNSSKTAKVLKYEGKSTMLTSPIIDALLAAAPSYGTDYMTGDPATFWGTSNSSGVGQASEVQHEASVIMGFEIEFSAPLVGVKIGGIDFTAKLKAGLTQEFSSNTMIEKSISFNASDEDAVVVTAIPYETYFYTVVKSDDPEQEGKKLILSFPKKPLTQIVSLEQYTQLVAHDASAPRLEEVLSHDPYNPFSYPSIPNGLTNVINGYLFEGTGGYTGVGGTGSTSKGITLSEEQSHTQGLSVGFEAELVVTAGSVKLGAGYGYNQTNTITKTIGKATSVGGSVPGLKPSAPSTCTPFKWNLVWYNYQKNGQTFPVINYLVQPQ